MRARQMAPGGPALALLLALLLNACGSDDDQVNFSVSGLQVTATNVATTAAGLRLAATDTANEGGTLEVAYVVNAQITGTLEIDTDFYMLLTTELEDGANPDIETAIENGFHLGRDTLTVTNGTNPGTAVLNIPPLVDISGGYVIVAVIDPDGIYDETDEEDNAPGLNNPGYPKTEVSVALLSTHDFSLVSLGVSDGAVVIDLTTLYSDTAEGAMAAHIVGNVEAVYSGDASPVTADLACELNFPSFGWQTVQIWDAAQTAYVDRLGVSFEHKDDAHYFGLDLHLTLDQVGDLEYAAVELAQETLQMRCGLDDTTGTAPETDTTNNSTSLDVAFYLFGEPEAPPVTEEPPPEVIPQSLGTAAAGSLAPAAIAATYGKSYANTFGDSRKFAVKLDFLGQVRTDKDALGGDFTARGAVELYIFRALNEIFVIEYSGNGYSLPPSGGFASRMVIFNATAFEESLSASTFSRSFQRSWEQRKVLVTARFTVGPIPMRVSAGVNGSLGLNFGLAFEQAALTAGGDVFTANFGAFANGGVDALIASAGVTVLLTLLDNTLNFTGSVAAVDLSSAPKLAYAVNLSDSIDVIKGKFGLYATVKGIKWCRRFRIPYPCGRTSTTYYLWLYQTPSVFQKNWTIYSKSGTLL